MNFWLLVAMEAPCDLRVFDAGELFDFLEAVGRQIADDVNERLAHQPLRAADEERRRIARLVALDPFADPLEGTIRILARADRAGGPCGGRRSGGSVFADAGVAGGLAAGVGD